MTVDVHAVVNDAINSVEYPNIPQELNDRIESHRKNLSNLAAALLAGGQDIDQIRTTITVVIDSFKEELLRVLTSLRENDHVG